MEQRDSKNIIELVRLSKMYKIYEKPMDLLKEVFFGKTSHRDFWALQDVSISVAKGEILGILGRNGAGKSTLLKILAGTLDKTTGSILVSGRIASILELGTGFHPEYTGRENIIMGGLCLGMSRKEIDAAMETIIDFSELRQFIDQPFKTYSSGMQARLTFSTAISIQPEIFIVDEALAVGDMLFQEKCLRKMREICDRGCTVLFVTHSLQYIYEFCTRCILLHQSQLIADGVPRVVGEQYERLLASERQRYQVSTMLEPVKTIQTSDAVRVNGDLGHEASIASESTAQLRTSIAAQPPHGVLLDEKANAIFESDGILARIVSVELFNDRKISTTSLQYKEIFTVAIGVTFFADVPSVDIGFKFQKDTGVAVIGDTTKENNLTIVGKKGETVMAYFEFICLLYPGSYLVGVGCTSLDKEGGFSICDQQLGALVVSVESSKLLNGLVDPSCRVWIEEIYNGN